MLLHRMTLISVRLFRKNLGNLPEFFWANSLPPPPAKNCLYAYEQSGNKNVNFQSVVKNGGKLIKIHENL